MVEPLDMDNQYCIREDIEPLEMYGAAAHTELDVNLPTWKPSCMRQRLLQLRPGGRTGRNNCAGMKIALRN